MEQSFARNRAKARDASEAIVCFVFARMSGGMTMKTNARSVLYFRFEYLFSLLRILLLNIIRLQLCVMIINFINTNTFSSLRRRLNRRSSLLRFTTYPCTLSRHRRLRFRLNSAARFGQRRFRFRGFSPPTLATFCFYFPPTRTNQRRIRW